jgi:hypothetical protein
MGTRWLNVVAWISAGAGLAAGVAMLLAAVDFHLAKGGDETGGFDSRHGLLIFSSWFLAAGITTGIALTIGWGIVHAIGLGAQALLSRLARLLPRGKRPSDEQL